MKLPGNKKEIQLKYNLTAREYNIIERCISFVGEPYNFLGLIPIYSTGTEIKKAFIKKRKSFNQPDQPEQIYYCDLCFELLSNKKIRNVYNLEFLEQRLQIYNQSIEDSLIGNIKFTLFTILSFPIDTIKVYNIGMTSISPLKSAIQLISRKGYSIFYKGIPATFLYGSISTFAIQVPLEKLINYLTTKKINDDNDNNDDDDNVYYYIKIISNVFVYTVLFFPNILIGGCFILSPESKETISFINTIKNVFFQKQLSDIPSPLSFNDIFKLDNFKHLFYSFVPTVCLMACRKLIINIMKGLEKTIIKKKYENPNSTFWLYSFKIYNNPFIRSFLKSLILSPIETIRLQYPLKLINSICNNQSIPIAINPISMAIQLIRKDGLLKLFNGVFALYPPILIGAFSSKYEHNSNPINKYDITTWQ